MIVARKVTAFVDLLAIQYVAILDSDGQRLLATAWELLPSQGANAQFASNSYETKRRVNRGRGRRQRSHACRKQNVVAPVFAPNFAT
jgi:hypothetical protein